jgi:hypothetical protein
MSDAALRGQISRDRAQADAEQANCRNCPGLDKCPNSMRGYYAMIIYRPYDNGLPSGAVSKCKKAREADEQTNNAD